VIEQNMLSPNSSLALRALLKPALIFTGHDHYGCTIEHPAADDVPPTTECVVWLCRCVCVCG
jgi:hypothetical protein